MTVWTTWPRPSSLVTSLDDSNVPLISSALFEGDPGALGEGLGVLGDGFGVLGAVGSVEALGAALTAAIGLAVPLGVAPHPPPITPMTIARANERQRQLSW